MEACQHTKHYVAVPMDVRCVSCGHHVATISKPSMEMIGLWRAQAIALLADEDVHDHDETTALTLQYCADELEGFLGLVSGRQPQDDGGEDADRGDGARHANSDADRA